MSSSRLRYTSSKLKLETLQSAISTFGPSFIFSILLKTASIVWLAVRGRANLSVLPNSLTSSASSNVDLTHLMICFLPPVVLTVIVSHMNLPYLEIIFCGDPRNAISPFLNTAMRSHDSASRILFVEMTTETLFVASFRTLHSTFREYGSIPADGSSINTTLGPLGSPRPSNAIANESRLRIPPLYWATLVSIEECKSRVSIIFCMYASRFARLPNFIIPKIFKFCHPVSS
mmetsp:Transcript_597/g.1397  ORF Transcript_597/g.1397 Transcript_597/m.1397 type:complete len:231 (-) Transcript_597:2507-3199(-)